MRKALLFVFCIPTISFGQALDEKTYSFINEVYNQILERTPQYYYLTDQPNTLTLKSYDPVRIQTIFRGVTDYPIQGTLPDSIITDFLTQSEMMHDSLFKWDEKKLEKVRVITTALVREHLMKRTVYQGKSRNWKKVAKRWNKQESRLALEERYYYSFSQPLFDQTGQYAVIRASMTCGNLCANDWIILFRKEKDGWKQLIRTLLSIS